MYNQEYYDSITNEEMEPAQHLAEILMTLYNPKNVCDIGCANGLYLLPFYKAGVYVGGGDVSTPEPLIPFRYISPFDITREKNITPQAKWDITLCLEVMEHIDEQYAKQAIGNLCTFSDIIIFSAAVPGQGGTHHVNCQPKEYWKKLFEENGYELDEIRTDLVLYYITKFVHMGWLKNNLMIFQRRKGSGKI